MRQQKAESGLREKFTAVYRPCRMKVENPSVAPTTRLSPGKEAVLGFQSSKLSGQRIGKIFETTLDRSISRYAAFIVESATTRTRYIIEQCAMLFLVPTLHQPVPRALISCRYRDSTRSWTVFRARPGHLALTYQILGWAWTANGSWL